MRDIPYGFCQCGCGRQTKISQRSSTEKGWVRGRPRTYINGHNRRKHHPAYDVTESGCWLWVGSQTRFGYGQGSFPGYKGVAHKWYWEQVNGPVPNGLELDHTCRNRLCVNPDHLEAVTQTENMRRSSATILTVEQVREIKHAEGGRGLFRELAERFGVHESTISAIRHGRNWSDVT